MLVSENLLSRALGGPYSASLTQLSENENQHDILLRNKSANLKERSQGLLPLEQTQIRAAVELEKAWRFKGPKYRHDVKRVDFLTEFIHFASYAFHAVIDPDSVYLLAANLNSLVLNDQTAKRIRIISKDTSIFRLIVKFAFNLKSNFGLLVRTTSLQLIDLSSEFAVEIFKAFTPAVLHSFLNTLATSLCWLVKAPIQDRLWRNEIHSIVPEVGSVPPYWRQLMSFFMFKRKDVFFTFALIVVAKGTTFAYSHFITEIPLRSKDPKLADVSTGLARKISNDRYGPIGESLIRFVQFPITVFYQRYRWTIALSPEAANTLIRPIFASVSFREFVLIEVYDALSNFVFRELETALTFAARYLILNIKRTIAREQRLRMEVEDRNSIRRRRRH
ncbi:uncharacterized protein V1516DRAFT_675757 [Lipomyces oligophaga]|uniref:uncharacterized protein n=1 Tax=Lipomyces oligophaga TaxID=45792 RepID=UPI0034CDE021